MHFEEVGYCGDVARALKEIATAAISDLEADDFDRARTGSGCQLPGLGGEKERVVPGLPQARSDTQQVRCAAAMAMTTDHCSGESGFSSDNIHPEAERGGHPASDSHTALFLGP